MLRRVKPFVDAMPKATRRTRSKAGASAGTTVNGTTTAAGGGTTGVTATEARASSGPRYWLLKAEPESRIVNGQDVKFSIDDLKEIKVSPWDGVRNHEAKNNMMAMKKGDLGFFYHSNCKTPGIVGVLKIAKEAYPDYTAFDKKHPYYDPKSKEESPKWFMVDVEYVRHLQRMIPLPEIKSHADELKGMPLLTRSRLSVTSVPQEHWDYLLKLSETEP
uniref:Thymocyte nuclear protein 1 n=1 Tax=Blastobotrys adeninivorans TaxID=409370 RepID=A0A060SZA4_BLAAD